MELGTHDISNSRRTSPLTGSNEWQLRDPDSSSASVPGYFSLVPFSFRSNGLDIKTEVLETCSLDGGTIEKVWRNRGLSYEGTNFINGLTHW